MKIHHAVALLAGLAVPMLPAPARSQIINAQFGTQLYTGAGADPLAGDHWLLVPGGNHSNVDISTDASGNTLNGVTLNIVAGGFFSFYGQTDGNNLIDGYDYRSNSPASFSINGLAENTAFTIYLYGTPSNSENGGRETDFALATANGGGTGDDLSRLATEPSTTFVAGFDYVVLTGTTDANGTISGTYSGPIEGDFNGFQLDVGVPEPSTDAVLLAGLGALVLLPRLRRG